MTDPKSSTPAGISGSGSTGKADPNVNLSVTFSQGQVPDLLRKLEDFLGVPLSLRSNTGEVVCKTDYFYGPCSFIRGTESGRMRCRRTYQNIENKLLNRKVPFVNICYAGFLIFAVPLEMQGEMIGTLLGAQIMPQGLMEASQIRSHFSPLAKDLGIYDTEGFFRTFSRVRCFEPDFQRITFMEFLAKLGRKFSDLAFSEKTWPMFFRDMRDDLMSLRGKTLGKAEIRKLDFALDLKAIVDHVQASE